MMMLSVHTCKKKRYKNRLESSIKLKTHRNFEIVKPKNIHHAKYLIIELQRLRKTLANWARNEG